MTLVRTALAVAFAATALTLSPMNASADNPFHKYKYRSVTNYYPPAPVVKSHGHYHGHHYSGPTVLRYSPTAPHYYRVPAPVAVYQTPSYSFYQPARVGVYVPPQPYASTTTTYKKGLLFHRTYSNTTTYYTPGFYRY